MDDPTGWEEAIFATFPRVLSEILSWSKAVGMIKVKRKLATAMIPPTRAADIKAETLNILDKFAILFI